MTDTSVAIIIPAWNEEKTIARCLEAVARQSFDGNAHVALISNGSTDRTSQVAASQRPQFDARKWAFTVLDIAEASKTAALNAGDALVNADVRIYLDADAILSPNSVEALVEALSGPNPRLAAPKLLVASGNRFVSRAYSTVWCRLPPVSDDVIGGGCYAVNRAGRARFGSFPNVIADDLFVRMQFARTERILVENARFEVPFPDGDSLLRVIGRWRQGNMELSELGYRLDDPFLFYRRLRTLACSPSMWSTVPLFVLIGFRARLFAKKRLRERSREWDRAPR